MDVPAGVTQEEGHTRFLYLPSALLALIFIATRIQPSLSLVNRPFPSSTVKSNFVYPRINRSPLVGHDFIYLFLFYTVFFLRGKIPVRVTTPRFELASQRQKVLRLPTEPPKRPVIGSGLS